MPVQNPVTERHKEFIFWENKLLIIYKFVLITVNHNHRHLYPAQIHHHLEDE